MVVTNCRGIIEEGKFRYYEWQSIHEVHKEMVFEDVKSSLALGGAGEGDTNTKREKWRGPRGLEV